MEVRAYPLQNQLGNTITRLNREVDVRVVEQKHLDLAAVVSINDASTGVNEVLSGKTATGSNTTSRLRRVIVLPSWFWSG
jgi:hypothetical protein